MNKKIKISEEIKKLDLNLLSEIIGENIKSINQNKHAPTYLSLMGEKKKPEVNESNLYSEVKNIHELINMYKDWAILKNYAVMTSEDKEGVSVKLFAPDALVKELCI